MKKIVKFLTLFMFLIFSGCNVGPTTPKTVKPKIDPNLPIIKENSLKAIVDINTVALEWAGCEENKCLGYYIYRSNLQKDGEKLKRIAEIKNKYSSHYVDTNNLKPNTTYLYAISVRGKQGTESNISNTIKVTTYPVIDSVSLIYAVSNLPRSVKIVWRPHTNLGVSKYILERKSLNGEEWNRVAVISNRLSAEYIDKGLKDNITYSYRLKAIRFDGIISNPSIIVTATTRPLPKGGLGLSASTSLPRKIELHWQISSNPDVVYYNIYRSSDAKGGYKVIAEKVDKNLDSFVDKINKNGVIKFYKITTVDKDGLETELNTIPPVITTQTLAPGPPTISPFRT